VNVVMPKLSDTMEEGKILRWLKKPGERVAVGDVLAEVETDKADMELEAEAAGVLGKILIDEGGSAAVGEAIAQLTDDDGAAETRTSEASTGAADASASKSDTRPPTPEPRGPRPIVPPSPKAARPLGPRPAAARSERPVPAASPVRPASAPAASRAAREELSKIRRTVARRMAESKREVPHFYMSADVDMSECARLKQSLATARPEPPISYTHLLLRGVALSLVKHPRINARYVADDAVEFSSAVHLGIAVALDDGLIVPVVHDCESKDLFAIAEAARALVERVRAGKAESGDLSGGTFTVSNLGMYPIEEFAAVINPPQAAVLAVGSLAERAVVRDSVVVARQTMRVTLSSDHRVIDGAEAAQFLQTLKELLENPVRLVL
jgi:pyruvate dehydrogenase E2 component (dihydrolipoamide acetyltransferase)